MTSLAAGGSASPVSSGRTRHSFRLGVQQDGGTLYLRLSGAFEWACVGRVEAALQGVSEATTRRVVFDLRGISVIDIAGLRTLLRANERARAESFEMVVVRPTALVNRIFTLTRAGEELNVVDQVPRGDETI